MHARYFLLGFTTCHHEFWNVLNYLNVYVALNYEIHTLVGPCIAVKHNLRLNHKDLPYQNMAGIKDYSVHTSSTTAVFL